MNMRLGFLASHNGSNMQAIIDACRSGEIAATPVVVISNNRHSGALERAVREEIPYRHLSSATHPDPLALDLAIADTFTEHKVELVLLCGYMKRLGSISLQRFAGRILNIHPSLLPRFGGAGAYGIHVHEQVLAAGETVTGATVHRVDAEYDTGEILAQVTVEVLPEDTPARLQARVLPFEHRLYCDTVRKIAAGLLA
ncbi:MAG: phosphoribosylglycinamide formyltransferase [Methylococcaceae bacterium]